MKNLDFPLEEVKYLVGQGCKDLIRPTPIIHILR